LAEVAAVAGADALRSLTYYLPGLAARIDRVAAPAAYSAIQKLLEKTTDSTVLYGLASTVAALGGQMEPGEATQRAIATLRVILEAMARPANRDDLLSLADSVAPLAGRMYGERAAVAVRLIQEAMTRTTDAVVVASLARALAVLQVAWAPEHYSLRTSGVVATLGNASHFTTLLAPLSQASRPLPGRFTEQQLLDFLKMPTCQRPAREVIVRQLGHQYGRTFANQWGFVEWAQKNRRDLDLTKPPVRPEKP
jgi:hypothetical protein